MRGQMRTLSTHLLLRERAGLSAREIEKAAFRLVWGFVCLFCSVALAAANTGGGSAGMEHLPRDSTTRSSSPIDRRLTPGRIMTTSGTSSFGVRFVDDDDDELEYEQDDNLDADEETAAASADGGSSHDAMMLPRDPANININNNNKGRRRLVSETTSAGPTSTSTSTSSPATSSTRHRQPPTAAGTSRFLVRKAVLEDRDELSLTAYDDRRHQQPAVDQSSATTTSSSSSSSTSTSPSEAQHEPTHAHRHQQSAAAKHTRPKRRHAPYFEREGKAVVSAAEGGSAILHCRVRNLGQLALSWVRGRDLHILTAGKYVFTNDDRFSVLHQGRSEDWMLKIRHVKAEDKGIYKCQVSTPEGILSKVVELRIVQPRAVIPGSKEYHVEYGSRLALECVIENSPQPPEYVFWYHNDRLVNFDDSDRPDLTVTVEKKKKTRLSIVVEHVNFTDSGNYTCQAPNTSPASVNVFVTESDKPAAIQRRKLTSGAVSLTSFSPRSINAPPSLLLFPWLLAPVVAVAVQIALLNVVSTSGDFDFGSHSVSVR